MGIEGIDHIYVETAHWAESVAFWDELGFSFAETWGDEGHRAGRLTCGTAAVVLAEVPESRPPAFNVFFELSDADGFRLGPGLNVLTPLQPTHWGTRWVQVADPEGRVFCLEEKPDGG